MRTITFHPTSGTEIELGNDVDGDIISGFAPAQERNVETVRLAFADHATQFDWGNYFETVTWRVERDHGTEADAVEFMRDHPQAVPFVRGRQTGKLVDEGPSAGLRVLQGAAIISAKCVQWDGRSTIFEYNARGKYWSETLNP